MNPKYPVYIISKGRWEKRKTSRKLEEMNVPYKIVIEPQEYNQYASVIDPKKILVLPFKNLGQGSIPARNFVWRHAIETGSKRHWILDDNLFNFYRLNNNLTIPVTSGTIFRLAEKFVDRYENVPISGFEYFMFIERRRKMTPYRLNTRVYSCILIDNSLPFRWRGRYNEDTDLSLRTLKAGYCTILFQAFVCDKTTTMTDTGGNTEDLYEIEKGRLKMAESLVEQHPDVTKVTWKWGRWQHSVNYIPFKKNKLIKKNITIPDRVNNYGMKIIKLEEK
tara:strand:- start:4359 stop:5192 length:834 start_codon:yes stop_codon:yes gene_type:complete